MSDKANIFINPSLRSITHQNQVGLSFQLAEYSQYTMVNKSNHVYLIRFAVGIKNSVNEVQVFQIVILSLPTLTYVCINHGDQFQLAHSATSDYICYGRTAIMYTGHGLQPPTVHPPPPPQTHISPTPTFF